MKLVDILALELKVWPEGISGISVNGYRELFIQEIMAHKLPANLEDNFHAIVTRHQWQAAVDALKAPFAATGEYLDPIADLPFGNGKRIEWNGDGLPPAGSSAEAALPEWTQVDVIAHGVNFGLPVAVLQVGDKIITKADGFRPIRTPEKIAAEEREAEIERLTAIFESVACGQTYDMRKGIVAVYDAIIRRIGTKDN